MAKRRPDQQLTQNNWDDELERDEVGQFQKADDTEMKQRVIRVAKRRIRTDETDANETGAKPVSVFSGFSLVSNKSSILGTDAPAASSSSSSSKPMFSFGGSFSSQPAASSVPFSASSSVTTPSFGNQPKVDDNKSSEFVTKLKELNDAVLSCIKGHVESGKACILTPIFKDYEKYVKELEDKNKTAPSSSPAKTNFANSTASTAPTSSFSFSFNAPKPTATKEDATSSTAASPVVLAPTQSTSATPMFSFGKPSSTFGAASSSGFSFSSAIQTQKPTESEKKTDGGTNGNTENAEDEDDEPPKVEYKQVVEDDSFYSKRCKVFVKDGDYKDRGTGTLYLKKVKDDKIQLIVRADTNLGNILLNILLSAAVPAKLHKNNVMLVCIPTPESDSKPKPVLVRVKTEADAAELHKEIEKYTK